MSAERLMPLGLAAIAVAEFIMSARWWRPYFTRGPVVFREEFPVAAGDREPPALASLEKRFAHGLGPSLAFQLLAPGEIAFRERVFELRVFSYSPVVRGLLRVDPQAHTIAVEARPNWFPLLFLVGMLAAMWGRAGALEVTPFVCVVLGAIYWVQVRLYRRVLRYAGGEDAPSTPVTSPLGNKVAWLLLLMLVAVAVFVFVLDHA